MKIADFAKNIAEEVSEMINKWERCSRLRKNPLGPVALCKEINN